MVLKKCQWCNKVFVITGNKTFEHFCPEVRVTFIVNKGGWLRKYDPGKEPKHEAS